MAGHIELFKPDSWTATLIVLTLEPVCYGRHRQVCSGSNLLLQSVLCSKCEGKREGWLHGSHVLAIPFLEAQQYLWKLNQAPVLLGKWA